MDSYTDYTRIWLDRRFTACDRDGIYIAHQPIYGFRKGHCEVNPNIKYMITYQVLKALSHLEFDSVLDAGCAEGYKSALIRSFFHAEVLSTDLSDEACTRAREIYDIEAEQADVHSLPFEDGQFDVVVCSETLEHVSHLEDAARELLRVCRGALVITVPCEPEHYIHRNRREKIPHAHIHCLDENSFDFLLPSVVGIEKQRYHNPLTKILAAVADAGKKEDQSRFPRFLVKSYNLCLPLLRLFFCRCVTGMIIRADDLLSKLLPVCRGVCLTILVDQSCYSARRRQRITARQIMDFSVPFHYPGQAAASHP